jgi:NAD(P)-dependent dehydrogenase (short-subunit alcohol dehydrogenase family)
MPDSPRALVITGAAGDLGTAICDSFLADGFRVYAADRVPMAPRANLVPVTLDVTDRQAVTALAERAGREAHLEVWINGAGIFVACPVLEAMAEDWLRIIAVNLSGVLRTKFHQQQTPIDYPSSPRFWYSHRAH